MTCAACFGGFEGLLTLSPTFHALLWSHDLQASRVSVWRTPARASMSLLAQNASLRGPWCLAAPRAPAGCAALTFGPCKRRRQAAVPAAARSAAGGQKQRQLASSAASSRLAEVPHTADALSTASSSGSSSSSSATAAAAGAVLLLAAAGPALAFDIHPEPANALSLPTWAVHTSSVVEWITAMGLM